MALKDYEGRLFRLFDKMECMGLNEALAAFYGILERTAARCGLSSDPDDMKVWSMERRIESKYQQDKRIKEELRKEHADFLAKKISGLVSMVDIQKDKQNERLRAYYNEQDLRKLYAPVSRFCFEHTQENITEIRKALGVKDAERIAGYIEDAQRTLQEIKLLLLGKEPEIRRLDGLIYKLREEAANACNGVLKGE